jgi:uncharacterized membrane protein YqiK
MIEAQERVVTTRETEIAERRKRIELIAASQEAEREAVKLRTAAEAEKQAATDRAAADRTAVAALQARFEVEADGKRKFNEAENLRSDASRRSALHQKLVDNLPSIIRESVKPMEQIESIRIVQVEGLPGFSGGGLGGGAAGGGAEGGPEDGVTARGGNLAESVVNSALRYRAQAPFVDTLLSEIGISPHSINVKGLEGLSTADYTPPGEDAKKDKPGGKKR